MKRSPHLNDQSHKDQINILIHNWLNLSENRYMINIIVNYIIWRGPEIGEGIGNGIGKQI